MLQFFDWYHHQYWIIEIGKIRFWEKCSWLFSFFLLSSRCIIYINTSGALNQVLKKKTMFSKNANFAVNHWPIRWIESVVIPKMTYPTSFVAITPKYPYWLKRVFFSTLYIFPPYFFGQRFCMHNSFSTLFHFFSCHFRAQSNVLNCENIYILSILCNRLACWKKQQLKNEIFA